MNENWKAYQRCLLYAAGPHISPSGRFPSSWYLLKHGLLLARWTDHFDCEQETEWWYCF